MTLNLTVEPAYIPYSEERLGDITLMEHQKVAKDSDEKLIILDAPTSSGKTLAMLTRLMETQGNGMFLYPTNELIKDQGRGIKELFDRIGVKSVVVPLEEETGDIEGDVDIVVAVVTGESLEGLAKTKGEAIKNIFSMVNDRRRLLLLTNVDTLMLLFKMRYSKGRTLLPEFLAQEYSVLAIDELHLYSGVAFANMVYLVWLLREKFRQVIVSSATIQNSTEVLKQILTDYRVIRPSILEYPNIPARQIRHRVNLAIEPTGNVLSVEDLDRLTDNVKLLFNAHSGTKVDTLTIVNSVVFSEQLADNLKNKYGEKAGVINGLVPSHLRVQRPLTVGTSAVEVGVDFDVNSIIFEGSNSDSFIQRLGRAGRHREGSAVAYIPASAYRKMKKFLENRESESFTIKDLAIFISRTVPHLENYSDFARSIYGSALFVAILYAMEKKVLAKRTKDLHRGIERGFEELKPPFFRHFTLDDILDIARSNVLEIIAEGGARGDILSTPVFLEKYKTYSRMNVLELPRTSFYFEDVGEIEAPRPPWLKSDRAAVVRGYGGKSRIEGSWRGPLLNKNTKKILFAVTGSEKDTTLSLHLDDEELEKRMEELLHKKIAYRTHTSKLKDWRFPRIYHPEYKGSCLVIGLDALVQKYVEGLHA